MRGNSKNRNVLWFTSILLFVLGFSQVVRAFDAPAPAGYTICTFSGGGKLNEVMVRNHFGNSGVFSVSAIDSYIGGGGYTRRGGLIPGGCAFSQGHCDVVMIAPTAIGNYEWNDLFKSYCSQGCTNSLNRILDIVILDKKPSQFTKTFQTLFKSEETGISVKLGSVDTFSDKEMTTFLKNYIGDGKKYKQFLDQQWATKTISDVAGMQEKAGAGKKTASKGGSYSVAGVVACSIDAQPLKEKKDFCSTFDFNTKQNTRKEVMAKMLEKSTIQSNPYAVLAASYTFGYYIFTADEKKTYAKKMESIIRDSSIGVRQRFLAVDAASNLGLLDYVKIQEIRKDLVLESLKKPFDVNVTRYLCQNLLRFDSVKFPIDKISNDMFTDPNAVEALGCLQIPELSKRWPLLIASPDRAIRLAALKTADLVVYGQGITDAAVRLAFGSDVEISKLAENVASSNRGIEKASESYLLSKLQSSSEADQKKAGKILENKQVANDDITDVLFDLALSTKDTEAKKVFTNAVIGSGRRDFDFMVRLGQLFRADKSNNRALQFLLDASAYGVTREQRVQLGQMILDEMEKEKDPEIKTMLWQQLMGHSYAFPELLPDLDRTFRKQTLQWQYHALVGMNGSGFASGDVGDLFMDQVFLFKKKLLEEEKKNPDLKLTSTFTGEMDSKNALQTLQISVLEHMHGAALMPESVSKVLSLADGADDKVKEAVWSSLATVSLVRMPDDSDPEYRHKEFKKDDFIVGKFKLEKQLIALDKALRDEKPIIEEKIQEKNTRREAIYKFLSYSGQVGVQFQDYLLKVVEEKDLPPKLARLQWKTIETVINEETYKAEIDKKYEKKFTPLFLGKAQSFSEDTAISFLTTFGRSSTLIDVISPRYNKTGWRAWASLLVDLYTNPNEKISNAAAIHLNSIIGYIEDKALEKRIETFRAKKEAKSKPTTL
jgi:hypothetical protein